MAEINFTDEFLLINIAYVESQRGNIRLELS